MKKIHKNLAWNEIKNQIKTINGVKLIKNKKDFMKTRFDSNDDLPLGKILNILVNLFESIFKNDNKYYPQVYMLECGYEL